MSGSPAEDSNDGVSDEDTLPAVPPKSTLMRRLSRRNSSPSSPRRYKPLSRSASLTVADFTSEWSEVFRMFDTNLDGVIGCDELGSKMRSLGYNVTQSEVQDLVHEWDKDDKGALSLAEFALMMSSSIHHSASSDSYALLQADSDTFSSRSHGAQDTGRLLELKAAFDLFDRDKDGLLDAQEVATALDLMEENLTEAEVGYVVSEADTDKDGAISFREFCDIVLGKSLSPRSPFYFHGKSARQRQLEDEERKVRLEYQTDHVSSRP